MTRIVESNPSASLADRFSAQVELDLAPIANLVHDLYQAHVLIIIDERVVSAIPLHRGIQGSSLRGGHGNGGSVLACAATNIDAPEGESISVALWRADKFVDAAGSAGDFDACASTAREMVFRIFSRVQESLDSETDEAIYWHQLVQGVTAMELEISRLKMALEPIQQRLAGGGDSSAAEDVCLDHLQHLINCEKHNALNILAWMMPDFMPGTDREKRKPLNPAETLRLMIPAYDLQARARRIRFELEGDDVWGSFPKCQCHESSLRRVYHNILTNAIKYSYYGIQEGSTIKHRVIRIRCHNRHDTGGLFSSISIENYGIGILPDELRLVRLPRVRGRLAKKEVQIGTGLGLSETERIIGDLGGRLSINSAHIHGETYKTTVRVILPRH